MTLHGYWRSTTSYRVRIALNLKGLAHETVAVDLAAGRQHDAGYLAINPSAAVPTLVLGDGRRLTQSMAILEYLDAVHPEPPILPPDPFDAAQVRAAALIVACDIHPVNNLRVGAKLRALGQDQETVVAWMNHWMEVGLAAFQASIRPDTPFCFGAAPGLADICLVPQLYNARRWGAEIAPLARLTEIEARCLALPAFAAARPENQPDAH